MSSSCGLGDKTPWVLTIALESLAHEALSELISKILFLKWKLNLKTCHLSLMGSSLQLLLPFWLWSMLFYVWNLWDISTLISLLVSFHCSACSQLWATISPPQSPIFSDYFLWCWIRGAENSFFLTKRSGEDSTGPRLVCDKGPFSEFSGGNEIWCDHFVSDLCEFSPRTLAISLWCQLLKHGWWKRKRQIRTDSVIGLLLPLNGHEFEQAPKVGDGQGSLVCYNPWGRKESDMTERLNWAELPLNSFVNTRIVTGKPYLCHTRSWTWFFLALVESLGQERRAPKWHSGDVPLG